LLSVAEYEYLKDQEYHDRPWTREGLEALAREVGEGTDREELDDAAERS